jgi:catechol 2,3-dioxygenase-like lactoylglutathione lyase family enzyme
MAADRPVLNMVNLVSRDVEASLAFYELLGLDTPEPPATADGFHHATVTVTEGAGLEIDNEELARVYAAPWRHDRDGPRAIINFGLPSRSAVDERYEALTQAGHAGLQPPWDAFWGARYAIVADPDGNAIGLMSPTDPGRRHWPPTVSEHNA